MKLEQLLAPLSPAAFFAEHWERKPLHLQGRPERFLGLGFDEATFWTTVAELPEDARCLRAIYYDQQGKHRELLAIRPSMARALWESGREQSRARRLATDARTLYAAATMPKELAVVDKWLRDHPG